MIYTTSINGIETKIIQRKKPVQCGDCRFYPKKCGYWKYGKLSIENAIDTDSEGNEYTLRHSNHNCQDWEKK